jgi:hypothetical protein
MALIFGAYSQLSPGTPLPILERFLTEIYKPMLTHIYKNPELRLHLYLPGTVLEWFEQNHPEMNMLIGDLVKKDQVELLTGAFHQAVLNTVQGKDRSGQLEATTTFIRKHFGKRARTVWFFNQIWNPFFVSAMRMGMLDRVLISGYDRLHDCHSAVEPFTMQEMGKTVEIFPTNDTIDALISDLSLGQSSYKEFFEALKLIQLDSGDPFHTVMLNLDMLLQACTVQTSLPPVADLFVTILDHFIQQSKNETVLLSSIPVGTITQRGYLAASWYGRDSTIKDIGSFNDMFIKYEELNHMYGRLLYLVDLTRIFKKNKDVKKRVEALLLKAASGGAFVLDATGGCYRSSYRAYVYRHLNEAERLLSTNEEIPYPRELDIDFDGHNEMAWMGKNIGVIVDSKGGTIAEINYLPTGWNYGNTFTGYAAEVDRISFPTLRDGSFQRSFNDVFLPHDARIEHYAKHLARQTFDTSTISYTLELHPKNQNEIIATCLLEKIPFGIGTIEITKHFRFRAHTIVVDYTLKNCGKHAAKGVFGSEMNLAIGRKDGPVSLYTVEKSRNRTLENGRVVAPNLKNVRIADDINRTLLSFASDNRFTLHKEDFNLKLATVMGMEVLYAYTLVLPLWDFDLASEESLSWTIGFRIDRRSRTKKAKKE